MADASIIDCPGLDSRTDFTSYVTTLRAMIGNDTSLLNHCKSEICNALWGSRNPDISGIGVSA